MGYVGEDGVYVITGHWDPTESSFAVLNTETPKGKAEHEYCRCFSLSGLLLSETDLKSLERCEFYLILDRSNMMYALFCIHVLKVVS